MNLINYVAANSLQGLYFDIVRAKQGFFLPDFLVDIINRYRFVTAPTNVMDAQKSGQYHFDMGVLSGDPSVSINSLDIFNDGILVGATTTDEADLIVNDFIEFGRAYYDYNPAAFRPNRTYGSSVVISLDASIDAFIFQNSKITGLISEAIAEDSGERFLMEPSRLTFMVDPTKTTTRLNFSLERRANISFDQNTYFSFASMTTKKHVSVLEELEKLAQGR